LLWRGKEGIGGALIHVGNPQKWKTLISPHYTYFGPTFVWDPPYPSKPLLDECLNSAHSIVNGHIHGDRLCYATDCESWPAQIDAPEAREAAEIDMPICAALQARISVCEGSGFN